MTGDVGKGSLCCHICGNSYANPTYLRRHIKNVHTAISREHQTCPKCSQTFKDLKTFWGHILQKHEMVFENFDRNYDNAKGGAAARREVQRAFEPNGNSDQTVVTGNRVTEILMQPDDPHSLKNWVSGDTCVKCDRSFFNTIGLSRHLKNVHSLDLKILQANAKKGTPTDEEILKQFDQVQGPEYSCIVCDLEFVCAEAEIRHKRVVHGIVPESELRAVERTVPQMQIFTRRLTFRCKDCGEKFSKLDNLERHFLEVHRDDANYLTCSTCTLEFISVRGMARHKKHVHSIIDPDIPDEDGLYPVRCKYCPEVLYFKDYKSHVRQFHEEHFGEVIRYMNEKELESTPSEPATCKICQKTFSDIKALKRHLIHVHTTPSSEFSCVECGKEFKDAGGLREHLVVHQKLAIEPYVKQMLKEIFGTVCHSKLTCGLCQAVTTSSFEARIHVYVKHPEAFQEHITHKAAMSAAQNATFPCTLCFEPFPTTRDTISHIESSHPNTEVPTCHVCGHKELKERDMNLHYQRYHPQTSRHVCRICQAKFNQAKQLRLHFKREHTTEGVQCPYCPEKHVKVKLHVTVKHPEHAEEYSQLVANAIREECNSRMEFNQLIDSGPTRKVTRRKRYNPRLVQSDTDHDSENDDENGEDEFDAAGETKLKHVPKNPPPPPELYKIEKSVDKHLIKVRRLSPPPPPVSKPEIQDASFNEEDQDVDYELRDDDEEDVKPSVEQLNESDEMQQGLDIDPDSCAPEKILKLCLKKLTAADLDEWKRPKKSEDACDDVNSIETQNTDANVKAKQKPISHKRRKRKR